MTTSRLPPAQREPLLLQAAVEEAEQVGFSRITQQGIAARAGVAGSLVYHYLGAMADVKSAVMLHAVQNRNLRIVAQGMALNDPIAMKAPRKLRAEAREAL